MVGGVKNVAIGHRAASTAAMVGEISLVNV